MNFQTYYNKMKTKLFTLLLAVAACVGTMFASTKIGDLYYNLNSTSQTAEVTSQNSSYPYWSTTITTAIIPASVEYNSVTYSVTSIGDQAFCFCSGLTSVTVPNSVTSIGYYAFRGCSGLTSVTIPNSVTSIVHGAFLDCSGLTSVTIPNSVTSIGDFAFSGCTGLTSPVYNAHIFACLPTSYSGAYTIPDGIESIAGRAFYECSGLTSVTIPNSVTSIGGSAFSGCTGLTSPVYNANVFAFMPTSYSGAYTIPDGIESIAGSAFYECSGLTSVTIPNSVTSIGGSAFYRCTGLTSPVYNVHIFACLPTSYTGAYTIPDGIESIGDDAFARCTGLTSITIPNSVTSIGEWAFLYCSGLTSVTIPNSVTSIGDYAFDCCSGLTSVSIPNSVTSIGFCAFRGCSGLTSVTIPNSVTSIGNSVFYRCSGLTSPIYNAHIFAYMPTSYSGAYTIPDGIESIAGGAFDGCSGLTSVTIPNSVTSIGESAFRECSSLTSVTIPNSVTSIGNYAFYDCSGLTSLTIPNSVTSIETSAFGGCTGLTSVTIPNSVTGIGKHAFYGCSGLTSVTIEAETPPTLGGSTVFSNTNNCPIYVPCGTLDAYKTAWSEYAFQIKYSPLEYQITGNVNIEGAGSVQLPQKKCEDVISATPNYGYHFSKWSDGNTDNPRTIELTQDTTFTAEFAKNSYAISILSANPEWGTTAGDTTALYLDEVEISAIPNYGYHFVQWDDNNTLNPRSFTLAQDTIFTATFAKNVYSITKNTEHGTISGNSSAEYLDFVTLTVTADYGYHFSQWSDGLKDNPRIAQITQDTTFTAEFAYDRVGTCGKDLALVWSYDPNNKVLTIGNAGSFTENMQFGVEAPNEMEELVIGNSVTAIGANAFAGISSLKKVSIGESVKTIGEQAFYNCVNLETIFNYRPTPTNTYSNAFDGVDKFECTLYVLPSSIDMYKAAAVWRDFYYTYAIGAEEATVTTNDVQVEPQDNAATLTWPTSNNAASYTIQITKDGVVFCTLIFNANGQLTGIAFAPGREGAYHAPVAIMTANGLQFTVTGLDSGTQYGYSVTAKDANDQPVATYSGEFTTTREGVVTGIESMQPSEVSLQKILRDGQIYILRGSHTYTLTGQEVK